MLHSNTVRRSALAVLAATLSIAMVACGGKTAPAAATVTSVALAANPTSVAVGSSSTVTATVTGTNSPSNKVTFTVTAGAANVTLTTTGNNTATVKGNVVGSATIQACSTVVGYTTKCATTTVNVTAAGGVTLTTARINFGRADSPVTVANYTFDSGAAYSATTGIGWVTEASSGTTTLVPLDMSTDGRNRTATNATNTTDARLYTQLNMQCGTPTYGGTCSNYATGVPSNQNSGAYEYKVVNGKYNVTVSVGDAAAGAAANPNDNLNSSHSINVEGTAAITTFVPTVATPFKSATVLVTVADGSLSVNAKSGQNTKINYIDIVPAP